MYIYVAAATKVAYRLYNKYSLSDMSLKSLRMFPNQFYDSFE